MVSTDGRQPLSDNERSKNERIIKGFMSNDQQQIYECYDMIYPMVYKYVSRNSGNEEDARTLAMECLSAFYECCLKEGFELNCKFTSFIYSICRNSWLKKLKYKKRMQQHVALSEEFEEGENGSSYVAPLTAEDQEETMFLTELKRLILDFAADTSDKCLEMAQLRFMEDKDHEEIAQVLGISVSASRKRMYDCNKKVAQKIISSPHYEELRNAYPFFQQYVEKFLK